VAGRLFSPQLCGWFSSPGSFLPGWWSFYGGRLGRQRVLGWSLHLLHHLSGHGVIAVHLYRGVAIGGVHILTQRNLSRKTRQLLGVEDLAGDFRGAGATTDKGQQHSVWGVL